MKLEVDGAKETAADLRRVDGDLSGGPMVDGMRQATLIVTRDAKLNAPVDTGLLRASITPAVEVKGATVEGVVGSNVAYAPYMELGTRPHWPPLAALETWARRHGTTAFVVARAIARRGLAPRRYLQRAFEDNAERIYRLVGEVVGRITG